MTKRSRRVWFGAVVVALLGLAAIAHVAGTGWTDTVRAIHGHP